MTVACVDTNRHIAAYSNMDPTRTTSLRNAFARALRKRFNELARVIRQAVADEDIFGLQTGLNITAFSLTPPGPGVFAFPRSADKVDAFMKWLQLQTDKGILQTIELQRSGVGVESAWTNTYIQDSYKRGVLRARYEMQRAGYSIPSIAETGGIDIALGGNPFHVDRLGLLYTRVYSELKGITGAMEQQISRVLAQGIGDGDNPRLLARKLVSTINGTGMGDLGIRDTLGRFIPARRRAEILARTEIVRAHHQATIQEYKNWGVEGVRVRVEWSTADDERVCDRCSGLQGQTFTLEEIEGMIPLHPQCRCLALPFRDTSAEPTNILGG